MFDVGTRVEVINNEGNEKFYNVGDQGTIVQVGETDYMVLFDIKYTVKHDFILHNRPSNLWYVTHENVKRMQS